LSFELFKITLLVYLSVLLLLYASALLKWVQHKAKKKRIIGAMATSDDLQTAKTKTNKTFVVLLDNSILHYNKHGSRVSSLRCSEWCAITAI